jgi:hypothetical protein
MSSWFAQLFPSVNVYVSVKVPLPAIDGVKMPAVETPWPVQVPPSGVYPVNVCGMF